MKNKIKSLLLVLAFGIHSIQHASFEFYDQNINEFENEYDPKDNENEFEFEESEEGLMELLGNKNYTQGKNSSQQNTTNSINTTPQVKNSSQNYTVEVAPTERFDLFEKGEFIGDVQGIDTDYGKYDSDLTINSQENYYDSETVAEKIADWLDGIKTELDASLEQTAKDFNTSLANTRQSLEILNQAFIDAFASLGEAIQLSNAKIKAGFEEMLKTNDAALSQIKQDLIDFGKGIDKEIKALNGIAKVMGAGQTAGNFILDMFNDIANMANNTKNVNYMKNNASYAVYKSAINIADGIVEIESALDQAGSEIVTTADSVIDYIQNGLRDLGRALGK